MSAPALTRRDLLGLLGKYGLYAGLTPMALGLLGASGLIGETDRPALAGVQPELAPRPAAYWREAGQGSVACELCPRRETLAPGQFGACKARQNIAGKLVTHAYGRPCVVNVDPIGKNPLAHFLPEATALSLAHGGCNLRCLYCQNWQYSQKGPLETANISGFNFAAAGERIRAKGIRAVSFTYTEADCTPEFAGEFAAYCGTLGIKRTLCTAGFVEARPLAELLRNFDAVTVTFKGPSEEFYRVVVDGSLKPVQESMVRIKAAGKWLEVATLVVPAHNDDTAGLARMAKWIAANLGADTPWHLEKFDPQYKLANLPPTPQKTLEAARQAGLDAGLKYVYISNLSPHPGNNTSCPSCGLTLITRLGFAVTKNLIQAGACPRCRTRIPGVFA